MLDVGLGRRDISRDRRQHAEPVTHLGADLHGKGPVQLALPLDREPLVRLLAELGEVAAIVAVDDDAATRAEVAEDRVARDGVAAAAVGHHHPFRPGDRQRRGLFAAPLVGFLRQQPARHQRGHALAEADLFVEFLHLVAAEQVERGLHALVRDLAQRELELA